MTARTAVSQATSEVFTKVDSLYVPDFADLFAPQGTLVFGNGAPMTGPAEVLAGVQGFFATIKALHHRVINEWNQGSDTVIELQVTYDRLDGGQVIIPVVTIWTRTDTGLFAHYRVFFDLAPVYA